MQFIYNSRNTDDYAKLPKQLIYQLTETFLPWTGLSSRNRRNELCSKHTVSSQIHRKKETSQSCNQILLTNHTCPQVESLTFLLLIAWRWIPMQLNSRHFQAGKVRSNGRAFQYFSAVHSCTHYTKIQNIPSIWNFKTKEKSLSQNILTFERWYKWAKNCFIR